MKLDNTLLTVITQGTSRINRILWYRSAIVKVWYVKHLSLVFAFRDKLYTNLVTWN